MANPRLTLEVDIIPHIEKLLAAAQQVSQVAAAGAPTGGAASGAGPGGAPAADVEARAQAIAKEVALTRQLRDEQERLLRGGGPITKAPTKGTPAADVRTSANLEIQRVLAERTAGVEPAVAARVGELVRTKPLQQQYYQQMAGARAQEEAQRIAALPPADRAKYQLGEEAGTVRAKTARLAAGRADEDFTNDLLALDIETKRFFATMEELRLAESDYTEAAIEGAVLRRQLNSYVQVAAESEQRYIDATAEAAMSRKRLADETILSLHGVRSAGMKPEEVEDQAAQLRRRMGLVTKTRQLEGVTPEEDTEAAALRRAKLATAVRQTTGAGADVEEIGLRSQYKASQAALNASVQEEVASNEDYILSQGRASAAKKQETIATEEQVRALGLTRPGGATVLARGQAVAETLPQTGATGSLLGGLLKKGGSTAVSTLGAFTTAGLVFGLVDAIKNATELEERFASLQSLLDEIGRGTEFDQLRSGIENISDATGVAAAKVEQFAERIVGITGDPARALEETSSAMKLSVVSGSDMGDLMQHLVPTAQAFGLSFSQIGDSVVHLHDKFGVSMKDIVKFYGEAGAVAAEAGFSFQELGVIAAAGANAIGVSMATVGTSFSRIIETMQGNQEAILGVFRRKPETKELATPLLDAYSQGEGGKAFKLLLADYTKLDTFQQQQLIRNSGMKRDWPILIGLFAHAERTLAEINYEEQNAASSTGTLEQRFADVSNTIGETTDRIKELFRNLVAGIAATGAGVAFGFVLKGIEQVLKAGMSLLDLFHSLNSALKFGPFDEGLLTWIVGITTAVLLAKGGMAAYTAVKAAHVRVTNVMAATEARLGIAAIGAAEGEGIETESIIAGNVVKTESIALTGTLAGETAVQGTVAGGAGIAGGAGGIAGGAGGGILGRLFRGRGAAAAAPEVGQAISTNLAGETIVVAGTAGSTAAETSGVSALGASIGGAITGLGSTISGIATGAWGAVSGVGAPTAAGAFSLGPVLAALATGLVATKVTADIMRPGLEKEAADATGRIAKMRTEDLEKMANESQGFWDRVIDNAQENLFHVDMPHTLYQKGYAERTRKPVEYLQDTGKMKEFTQGISDANLNVLNEWVNSNEESQAFAKQYGLTDTSGNAAITRENLERQAPAIEAAGARNEEGANKLLEGLHNILYTQKTLSGLRETVDKGLAGVKESGVTEGLEKYLSAEYDPKGALATGVITPTEYKAKLEQKIADERAKLPSAENQAQAVAQLNSDIRDAQERQNKLVMDRLDIFSKRAQTESATPAADVLQVHVAALPGLATDEDRYAQLPQLRDEARKWYEEQVSKITDPIERAKAETEGLVVPESVRRPELTLELGRSSEYEGAIKAIFGEGRYQETMQALVDFAVKNNTTIKQAWIARLKDQDAKLKALGITDTELERAIAAAENLPDIGSGGVEKESPLTNLQNEDKRTQADINRMKAQPAFRGRRAQAQADLEAKQKHLDSLLEQQSVGGVGAPKPEDIQAAATEVDKANQVIADGVDQTAEALMQWAVINAFGDPVKQATARLAAANKNATDALKHAGGDITDPDYIKSQQDRRQAEIQITQAEQEHDLAVADWAEVNAAGDPYAVAIARLDKTKKQVAIALKNAMGNWDATPVIRALQDQAKAQQEVDRQGAATARAQRGILLAQSERDPLQVALLNQQQAAEDLAAARGTIDEADKLAAKIRADHQVEDAINAGTEASVNLAIAILEAAGDSVGAAQETATEAQRKLDLAISQGITDPKVIDPLKSALVQANANARNVALDKQQQIIDFQLQMGQITTDSAIESLRLLLSQTQEGTQQYMQLALKIHQLEQQAGQNLQFNLPTTLGLPTLYEARRVTQSTAAGIGYQDNRNVQLVVQVNGAQDPMTVTNQVVSALQSAMGGGPTLTPQIGMGA